MYIAFKWLLGLTFVMWLFACSVDVYFICIKENNYPGTNIKDVGKTYKNLSARNKEEPKMDLNMNIEKPKKNWFGLYHYYAIFCAAGFIISAVNKRKKLILFASLKKAYLKNCFVRKYINSDYLKRTANETYGVVSKHVLQVRSDVERVIQNWQGSKYFKTKPISDDGESKEVLLKKLKDMREEKKNLSLLLAAAICENRNIVVGYRLDSMAKDKLVVQTKENDKKRKDCQSQYVNFQHLYSVTYHENLYLHSQIKHLTRLKEIAEKNLLNLVHEIWISKNEKLIAFCSRFVVQSKEKVFNSDIRVEIEKFLQSTSSDNERCAPPVVSTKMDNKCKSLELKKNLCLSASAPKLVGLPGEHIWTVKDRDGFIEKLYEYDFESNGNTIRRIREYSVYHDKDCFFENLNSRTIIHDDVYGGGAGECKPDLNCRIQNQRFLTGSQAFQLFLQNTQNVVIPVKTFYRPSISYG